MAMQSTTKPSLSRRLGRLSTFEDHPVGGRAFAAIIATIVVGFALGGLGKRGARRVQRRLPQVMLRAET